MISGQNPDEDVINSYPGLRQELNRIQKITPSADELLAGLIDLQQQYKKNSPEQLLINDMIMQVSMGKLQPFDLYFTKIKIDLMGEAIKNNMPFKEINEYINFINEMQNIAAKSNKTILNVFEQRFPLTAQEIDMLDNLEKIVSRTSIMSHNGGAFLRHLRFEPPEARIPFQMKRNENGSYTLSTAVNEDTKKYMKQNFGLDFVDNGGESQCTLSQKELVELMHRSEQYCEEKKERLRTTSIYRLETIPCVKSLLNETTTPELEASVKGFAKFNGDIILEITANTEEQFSLMRQLFNLNNEVQLTPGHPLSLTITPQDHKAFQKRIRDEYNNHHPSETEIVLGHSEPAHSIDIEINSGKDILDDWQNIPLPELIDESKDNEQRSSLISRFENLISDKDNLAALTDFVNEAKLTTVKQLLEFNDETLSDQNNIRCILNDEAEKIQKKSEGQPINDSGEKVSLTNTL